MKRLCFTLSFLICATFLLPAQDWAKTKLEKSSRHQEWVKIKSGDREVNCFVVYPEVKDKATTIVMIHEIFGLTDWAKEMADEIAAQMKTWAVPLPLPTAALWPLCLLQEAVSRLIRRPNVLSLQKYAELSAAGWVCDPARLRQELDFTCTTTLKSGIASTLVWYRQQGWL